MLSLAWSDFMETRLLEVMFCSKEGADLADRVPFLLTCSFLVKPEVAGLPVSLPCHPAWFILDLLVVPVSLMHA